MANMKIETTDFHTAIRRDPDPKKQPEIFQRGAIVEVDEKLGRDLIARGHARLPGKPAAKEGEK